MASTFKAQAQFRTMLDHLKLFVAATLPVVSESFDTDGNPVITLSADATPAAGEKVVVLRCKAVGATGAKNILGQDAEQFSHHVIQICTESNNTAGAAADILSPVELLPILVECGRRGSFVEWYQTANATVPSTTAMVAANLKSTWRDLYWNVLKAS